MKSHVTKELLFDYFAGRATALQKQMIEEWVKEPAQEELFYEYLHEWELRSPQYLASVSPGMEKYREILHQQSPSNEPTMLLRSPMSPIRRSSWIPWTIAAAVLILVSLGATVFQQAILYRTYATAFGETQLIPLTDGSKVTLNANSSLQVPRFGFGSDTREVFLKGEANFSIIHTHDDQRFIVHTDSAFQVEVLGTEFTVFARPRGTKVVLNKGKVKVQYQSVNEKPQQLMMKPGDLVSLDQKGKLHLQQVQHPENYAAWKNRRFVFENTSLTEINDMLQENYGLKVEIKSEALLHQTLTGSFQASTADELLQAISQILEINVIRQDSNVILIDNK